MTLLNASASFAPESLYPLALKVQESVPTLLPVEVEGKAKRKRKTKSEYAAMPRPEPREKNKQHKGGRPALAEEDKLKCVSSLVSIACYDHLQATAGRLGISVSQAIRWLIDGPGTRQVRQRMGQLTKRGLSEEERKQLRDLTGMAANLNQLAKLAHTAGYAALAMELVELADKIRIQLNAFNK